MLQFKCPLLVVTDLQRSINFYEEVIGDRVAMNFGQNVTFEGGYCLQECKTWLNMIQLDASELSFKNNCSELYFEEDDFDGFITYLKTFDTIVYLQAEETTDWGQRLIRFYDPDFHIIEVGESMDQVIQRMLASGMSVEETSEKSQYPMEYVRKFLK